MVDIVDDASASIQVEITAPTFDVLPIVVIALIGIGAIVVVAGLVEES